jgi:hypothetical protein
MGEIRRASFTRSGLCCRPRRIVTGSIPGARSTCRFRPRRDARVAEIRALLERHGLAG